MKSVPQNEQKDNMRRLRIEYVREGKRGLEGEEVEFDDNRLIKGVRSCGHIFARLGMLKCRLLFHE